MILWCKTYKHVSASTVSLSYRTCRHISVSTVKRHQPTSRYNEIDSKLENTVCTHNRNRSFQAVRGTVKVTVPYRNFFHPQTSNQRCFSEKCLASHFWSFGNCSTDERLTFSTPKLAVFVVRRSHFYETSKMSQLCHSNWVLIWVRLA